MTKWVIRALYKDGTSKQREYERNSPHSALSDFQIEFNVVWAELSCIDIDRVEDGEDKA